MRLLFLLLTIIPSLLVAQISNVRQTIENNRIIITYDLVGNPDHRYDIEVKASNESTPVIIPMAIVGDLVEVAPAKSRTLWWEPQLEGMVSSGWRVSVSARISLGIKWIFVEGGPGGDFYLSATEVTFDQYDAFCEATGKDKPKDDFGRARQPVINVNVADAAAFCAWLSRETGKTVRLPAENEWLFAAAGGNQGKGYDNSGSLSINDVAWYDRNSGSTTHEVAQKKPNVLGLYDMSGNVSEWCGTGGVILGGSWLFNDAYSRLLFRQKYDADGRNNNIGFRLLQK